MSETGHVNGTRRDRIYHIEVDRADKMNGFTPEMFDALSGHLTELDENPELWVGVITFAGKHTTAGLDLPRFAGSMQSGERDVQVAEDSQVDAFALRRRCRKPVIMAVQGITFTIGIEMLLAADIVIAADNCRFCQMEPKRGLAVFGGAHVRYVQRAGWGNAMYHLLLADEFDANRARELGFVQEVLPVGEHTERAFSIAEVLCQNAPIALQEIKRGALIYLEQGEKAAFDEIAEMRRKTANSADFKEGIASFVEKRAPVFTGQ